MALLQQDEALSASTKIRSSADEVYAVISDITRIPQWSPETVRAQWLAPNRFQAWNRRGLGRWKTVAEVVEARPGREFSFVVQALGGPWTQWSYLIEPEPESGSDGTTRLTEKVRMCVALPMSVVLFERLLLFVRDRRTDLQANLETSVDRIRAIVEAGT